MAKEQQGLSLIDIGAPFGTVPIGDKVLKVYGLSADNLVELMTRFPEASAWLAPGAVKLDKMIPAASRFLEAVIALSTTPDHEHVEAAEKVAAKLSVETQLDIIKEIVKLTFKDGFGPFASRIAEMFGAAASVNFGRVMGMNSQAQSSTSSQAATTVEPSGN
jgi:hypothetical protein